MKYHDSKGLTTKPRHLAKRPVLVVIAPIYELGPRPHICVSLVIICRRESRFVWSDHLQTCVAFGLIAPGFKGAINLNLTGSGGQSFGVFLAGGINVKLTGEANDYVGKGMAGGEIVIVPPSDAGFAAESASIVGNTCLYGATGA